MSSDGLGRLLGRSHSRTGEGGEVSYDGGKGTVAMSESSANDTFFVSSMTIVSGMIFISYLSLFDESPSDKRCATSEEHEASRSSTLKLRSMIEEVKCGAGSKVNSNFSSVIVGKPIIELTDTSLPRAKAIVNVRPFTKKGVLYRITADRIPWVAVSNVLGSVMAPHNFIGSNGFVPLNSS